jgi:hypothetical protein
MGHRGRRGPVTFPGRINMDGGAFRLAPWLIPPQIRETAGTPGLRYVRMGVAAEVGQRAARCIQAAAPLPAAAGVERVSWTA